MELNLRRRSTPEERLADFLGLCCDVDMTDDLIILHGLRLYAAYRAHNLCRHGQCRIGAAALEAYRQALREAVRGHRRAAKAYDLVQARFCRRAGGGGAAGAS